MIFINLFFFLFLPHTLDWIFLKLFILINTKILILISRYHSFRLIVFSSHIFLSLLSFVIFFLLRKKIFCLSLIRNFPFLYFLFLFHFLKGSLSAVYYNTRYTNEIPEIYKRNSKILIKYLHWNSFLHD